MKHDKTMLGIFLLALAPAGVAAEQADHEGHLDTIGASSRHHPSHHAAGATLDERVRTLTQALGLDAGQQIRLKAVLERQREQLNRVWAEQSVPANFRVKATQVISDQTADQIRALLNDEQKKRYNPPRPLPDVAPARPDVEAMMEAVRRK